MWRIRTTSRPRRSSDDAASAPPQACVPADRRRGRALPRAEPLPTFHPRTIGTSRGSTLVRCGKPGVSLATVEAERPDPSPEEAKTAAITREVIQLTKTLTGRGPTKGKTYLQSDCVLVLMREAHTPSEGTMAGGGRQRQVAQTRVDISEDARRKFIEIIEQHTGRKVVGFMSSSQQDPSLLAQVYVLETSPLLHPVPEG